MAIPQSRISAASERYRVRAKSLNEAQQARMKTAFLCHSHLDERLARGMATLLDESGWNVYIDWLDASMPDTPNRATAAKLQQRIVTTNYFLFLATDNSMKSRWCPWEIGYADGKKSIDTIMIIPTSDGNRVWHGSEYLQLYSSLDYSDSDVLAVWEPGKSSGTQLRYR